MTLSFQLNCKMGFISLSLFSSSPFLLHSIVRFNFQEADPAQVEEIQEILKRCARNRKDYLEQLDELPREVIHSEQMILGREIHHTKPPPSLAENETSSEAEVELEIDFEQSTRALALEKKGKFLFIFSSLLWTYLSRPKIF